MRLALCAAVTLVALPAAASASPPTSAAVASSPDRAGARPVVLTFTVHTLLQCGRLQGQTIVIGAPAQLRLPQVVPVATVRIGHLHPRSVTVRSHTVTIKQRPLVGPICTSLTFGGAEIVFARGAGIGNPPHAGRYAFRLSLNRQSLHALLRVR